MTRRSVTIRPVERVSVQGRHLLTSGFFNPKTSQYESTGQKKGTTKAPNTFDYITFPIDDSGRNLLAGMEEQIENPWKGFDKGKMLTEFNLPVEWSPILDQVVEAEYITKQTLLEIRHSVPPGTYTQKKTTDATGKPVYFPTRGVKMNIVEMFKLRLRDGANTFFEGDPNGDLAIQLIETHPEIAPNYESVVRSRHRYYISSEEGDSVAKNAIEDKENVAIVALYTLLEQHQLDSQQMVSTVVTESDYSNAGAQAIKGVLNGFVKNGKGTKEQRSNIDKFLRTMSMLKNDNDLLKCYYLVEMSLSSGRILRRDNKFIWPEIQGEAAVHTWTNKTNLAQFFQNELRAARAGEPSFYTRMTSLLGMSGKCPPILIIKQATTDDDPGNAPKGKGKA